MSAVKIPGKGARGRGFTLTELLIVVGIIAILIGVLVPGFGRVREAARNASTRSVMSNVSSAVVSFRNDHARMPGYFDNERLGSWETNEQFVTQNENAVLELAGGVVEDPHASASELNGRVLPADASPSEWQFIEMRVGSRNVVVDTLGVGHAEGAYLQVGESFLRSPAPEDRLAHSGMSEASERRPPAVLDAWGRPLLLWFANESPGRLPEFADFSIERHANQDDPSDGGEREARFYWWKNAGYLAAEAQATYSTIGAEMTPDGAPGGVAKPVIRSIAAALGHPEFASEPDENGFTVPMASLGSVIVQSAGGDEVFLSNRVGRFAPAGQGGRNGDEGLSQVWYEGNQTDPLESSLPISRFDDIVFAVD